MPHGLCSFKVKCINSFFSCWAVSVVSFCFQPKEKGSTRVHALNNVNKALQVLQKNNVSGALDMP